MTTVTVRNGIDVGQLVQTIEAIGSDPSLAEFTFRATSTWKGGTHSLGRIEGFDQGGVADDSRSAPFELSGDEPLVLLGENRGPNAVELLLQALGFCYAVGFVANAAARGIPIDSLEFDVEGDLDVHRFLGLEIGRPGFTAIRATGRVRSPGTDPDALQELVRYVVSTSPVGDSLAAPVPIETALEVLP